MRRISSLALLLILLIACGRKGAAPPAGEAKPATPGEAASADGSGVQTDAADDFASFEFEPPEDGELSEPQMEMLLAVETQRAALRAAGGTVPSEAAVARDLGHNPKEHLWVAERVREVLRWQMRRDVAAQLAAGDRDYRRLLETLRAQEKNPARVAELDNRIAQLADRQVDEAVTLALAYNAELVGRYRERLDAVATAEERFSTGRLAEDQPISEALVSGLSSDLIGESPLP